MALALAFPARASTPSPVVVELFTSQGCASCPPADAYLGDLARRRDLIVLSFHVDYWDYMGWKDPFASAQATTRQRRYARALNQSYVYTPQIVVDGRGQSVGTERGAVERLIAEARTHRTPKIPVAFSRDAKGRLQVTVSSARSHQRAAVWVVLFDRARTTRIKRGENKGRELTAFNVVRSIRRLATWEGAEMTIPIDVPDDPMDGRDGCVVIVQSEAMGPILGAAYVPLTGPGNGPKN